VRELKAASLHFFFLEPFEELTVLLLEIKTNLKEENNQHEF